MPIFDESQSKTLRLEFFAISILNIASSSDQSERIPSSESDATEKNIVSALYDAGRQYDLRTEKKICDRHG